MPILRNLEPYDRNKHWRQGKRPATVVVSNPTDVAVEAASPEDEFGDLPTLTAEDLVARHDA